MFWQFFFPFVLGYFCPTHNAFLSLSSFAAFQGIFRTLPWARAEASMKVGDPTAHLGLALSSKDIFGRVAPSSHPGQLWPSEHLWAEWRKPWSSRVTTRPRKMGWYQGSCSKLWAENWDLTKTILNFCRKELHVAVNSPQTWHSVASEWRVKPELCCMCCESLKVSKSVNSWNFLHQDEFAYAESCVPFPDR